MKLVTVLGTRPQFVKAAPLHVALVASGIDHRIVDTGQHYDDSLAGAFLRDLGLPRPVIDCGVGSATHGAQTGRMLERVEAALEELRPDRVLVVGDTNSTLAGALAAAKMRLPVAHVEAGLRSGDRFMPEEINRVLTDQIADRLFAPTASAVDNLRREGRPEDEIFLVGDVGLEATLARAPTSEEAADLVASHLGRAPSSPLLLVTFHRAENLHEEPLRHLVAGLCDLAADHEVVLPLHPGARRRLTELDLLEPLGPVHVVPPLGYRDILAFVRSCLAVVTDSGGLQKESFFLGVPCVTLRPVTEWTELVEHGWNRLVAPQPELGRRLRRALSEPWPSRRPPLFGNGDTATRIASILSRETPLGPGP